MAEAPTETLPTIELPNPVIQNDMDVSKSLFNEAMEAEKSKAPEPEVSEPPSKPDTPPSKEPEAPSKDDNAVASPSEPSTTADEKVEAPPESKSMLPEELLTGVKTEPKTDDAISELDAMVLPKNAKPEQVASFSKLKAEAKRIIEERTSRITELETKTSDSTTKAEIEAAQERIKAAETKAKEYEQTIERLAFTESPRFKQFLNDESATLTGAKAYLEGTEINPDIVDYAARLNGQQRIKVLREAGADAELIAAVSPYLAQYDAIQRHKVGAMENWKVESQQYAEQVRTQQQAAMQQQKQVENEIWEKTVRRLSNLVPFRKFDGNDSWNSRADELLQKGKTIFNGEGEDVNYDVVAEKVLKGVAYDSIEELFNTVVEKNKQLSAENARLKSSKPGASNGQGSTIISNDASLSDDDRRKRDFNTELARARG